jgi:hypothetical protein
MAATEVIRFPRPAPRCEFLFGPRGLFVTPLPMWWFAYFLVTDRSTLALLSLRTGEPRQ